MTALLARLLPLRSYIVAAVVLALLAALGVQTLRLDRAELKLAAASEIEKSLTARIDAQNAGIAALLAASKAQEQATQRALQASQKAVARATQQAARIRASTPAQTCEQALQVLVQDAAGVEP